LKCPKCGGEMKVISFIEQPFVIRRILKHLDLWEDPRPPQSLWNWYVNPMRITFHAGRCSGITREPQTSGMLVSGKNRRFIGTNWLPYGQVMGLWEI